eukprot:CAMPEP_0182535216 /NCGR_PEP_ID=MMETSP1323-20130603/17297_1 /TAXON_ID=236787 /ORGANISM="Florenciella parvula, Strain RCC1693" /LENGTH=85 /DNA_ID=CAMNT_0024745315 /DNA_START=380 /DNA_END=637 /DNA_ORIENTATION=-
MTPPSARRHLRKAPLGGLHHIHKRPQTTNDVIQGRIVATHHVQFDARGTLEVELGTLVVGLRREILDEEITAALLNHLKRLVNET